jgi:fructoselysine 6-phosphate deglycase
MTEGPPMTTLENFDLDPEVLKNSPNPNYLEGDFLRSIMASTYDSVQPQAARAVAALLGKGPVRSVYLVGAGGSNSYIEPIKYILDRHSGYFVERINATEFATRRPRLADGSAIVVLTSHNGETEDAVVAARWAKSAGARTVAITAGAKSTLAGICDETLLYSKDLPGMPKTLVAYLFAAELLRAAGEPVGDELVKAIAALPEQLHRIKDAERARGMELAQRYQREEMYYLLASGILSSLNYQYAICILNEMLWVDAAHVHSGEFRHGPFEVADKETTYLMLMDNGESRALDERALKFLRRVTDKVIVFDAAQYPEVHPLLSPFVIGSMWYWFPHGLSTLRQHPLSVRRYMWKVDY